MIMCRYGSLISKTYKMFIDFYLDAIRELDCSPEVSQVHRF